MKPKKEQNKLVVLNPPPGKRSASIPLSRSSEIRYELARLYREARAGVLEAQTATRLAYLLQVLAKVIEQSDLEQRIAALEEAQGGNNGKSTW